MIVFGFFPIFMLCLCYCLLFSISPLNTGILHISIEQGQTVHHSEAMDKGDGQTERQANRDGQTERQATSDG